MKTVKGFEDLRGDSKNSCVADFSLQWGTFLIVIVGSVGSLQRKNLVNRLIPKNYILV